MKKYIVILSTFLVAVLLGGCLSISLPDRNKLEVSPEGIQVKDETESTDDDNQVEVSKPVEIIPELETEVDGPENGEAVESDNLEEEEEFLIDEGFGGCSDEYYLLLNRLTEGFPLSPCPVFYSIEVNASDDQRTIFAKYEVEQGVYEQYDWLKAYFEEKGYTFDSDRVRGEWANLVVSDNQMNMEVEISMAEANNYEKAIVELTYSESPPRVYPVVEALINWDEQTQSHGSCPDEHYVLVGNMLEGFPFKPCLDVTFLRVDYENNQNSMSAVYSTDDGIADWISEDYKDFFTTKGITSESIRDGDDADVIVVASEGNMEFSMKLTDRADGRVGIYIDYVN
ncbi:hypothetical protein ACXYMX_05005 [Sporosarcina sp. CAU 1771]